MKYVYEVNHPNHTRPNERKLFSSFSAAERFFNIRVKKLCQAVHSKAVLNERTSEANPQVEFYKFTGDVVKEASVRYQEYGDSPATTYWFQIRRHKLMDELLDGDGQI